MIALTGHDDPSERQACLDTGMDDHLTKPIRVGELVAALERLTCGGLIPAPLDAQRPDR